MRTETKLISLGLSRDPFYPSFYFLVLQDPILTTHIIIAFKSNPAVGYQHCIYITCSALFFPLFFFMAATTTIYLQDHNNETNNGNNAEITREEIQTAISKAVELRALHAALTQGSSPGTTHARFPSPSPASRSASHFSAQDYPVFTPSYEDEPHQNPTRSRTVSESWDENMVEGGNSIEIMVPGYKEKSGSRKGLPFGFANHDSHTCPADDTKSVTGSTANHITVLQTSPANDYFKSRRRSSLGDLKPLSSCNRCKPAVITSEYESTRNHKSSNIVVPLTDSHASFQTQPKSKGVISWLFPRFKKKHRSVSSPNRTESEEVSQVLKDMGIMSIESLKRELMEAHESRDAALMEVSEMRSSLGELKHKLEYLESYCEELKKVLRQTMHTKETTFSEKLNNHPQRGIPFDGNGENLMPVAEEVMVEGFLQIVSESRLSVKQFCKTLICQIEETDHSLMDNLNLLLQPYRLSLNSKYSKAVLYHFEAFINQSFFQDFENIVFQKNGCTKFLDPRQDRQAQFSSFVALRNLSWNEVLRKGTKYYSEEFSKFCDQKMSCIITTLSWTRPWPEQLLQAFFVAAKCIWLLHLLAFSFNPPLGILRVEENRSFDPHYMEDLVTDRQRSQGPSRVKIVVVPGFYVQDRILRCRVICRHKSAP
ncbi:IRK-interacting protein-like [Abrus precatorius]|uniref:IRK-interacting protein-like n=1 Tax=Abrus precatorius TaxID=3816 RepID=A0A8B8KFR6_ABRPR|nr:IRK-interacting protein-like [Abrus precatorius]